MAIEITRPGKNTIILETPVMPAAGIFGFGDVYRDLVNIEKLGALVTNPVTYQAWHSPTGTRVVALDAGMLMHTGLANPGLSKVLGKYRMLWRTIPLPIILHLVADTKDNVSKSASRIDAEDAVDAIELGLHDDIQPKDAEEMVRAAVQRTDKPVLVRLPAQNTFEIAEAAEDGGAGALVACAPPRGTAREPKTGRLVSGRIYSPLVKPMILRIVGQLARRAGIPVIGAGGIHSAQDGRDYLDAGACAIQVDSVTWVQPDVLELIARDLGGLVVTREAGAFPDEWHPGMGETERQALQRKKGEGSAKTEDTGKHG